MPNQNVEIVAPQAPPIALICDSPHSGTLYPADFGHAVPLADLRKCEDTLVDTLWADAPHELGNGLVFSKATTLAAIYDDPYAGQDLIREHARPEQGCESLQLEINRKLYLDEETREPNARCDGTRADVGRVLRAVAAFVRAETARAQAGRPAHGPHE